MMLLLRRFAGICAVFTLITHVGVSLAQDAVGHYTIVGSKHIRPHSEYHVSVSLHDAQQPTAVRLTIDNGAGVRLTKEIVVQPFSTVAATFELGELPKSAVGYKLIAEGLTGIRFRDETEVLVLNKQISALVQTDKALYKPGDMIRFRVLVLDPNTKPVQVNGGLQIHMLDGNANRVKQWSNATVYRGVHTGELQLSEYPVLGKWTLVVELLGQTKKKTLEVAEYVLPRFEVSIETEKDVLYKDEKIVANIRGRYAFGKPVRGEATVTLQPKINGAYQPLIGDLIARKIVKIETKGSVEFDIRTDLKLTEEYERDLQMDVLFTEERTDRIQTAQTIITIRRSHFKITKINKDSTFKEDAPFELELQVSRHDGHPMQIRDLNAAVELSYSASDSFDGEVHIETGRLHRDGRLKMSWVFPANRSTAGFYMKAKYMDLTEGLGFISKYDRRRIDGLEMKVLTKDPVLGKTIAIEIQSSKPLTTYTYHIFGRGDILKTETVTVPGVTQHEIKFLASFAMVPTVKIIVYYLINGEMHAASETLQLRDRLQNSVTLEPTALQTAPGNDVDLKVITRPNAFVGLMAVDQNVLQMQHGNDLSQMDVFDELDKYSNAPLPYRQNSASFDNIGAFLISNVHDRTQAYRSRPLPITNDANDVLTRKKADIGPAHVFRTNTKPPRAGPYAFSRIPASKWRRHRVQLARSVQDTWMFINGRAGPDGVYTLHKSVPDTMTSWVITAFALDPVTGLAITQEPTQLRTVKPFAVSLNLPYSMKRGEVLAIPVVVFNSMNAAFNAEVTLLNEDQDFEYVDIGADMKKTPTIELYRRKWIAVKSNETAATSFMIRPTKSGALTIKVTATSTLASDRVERILRVEPEGVPVYTNNAMFIDLRDKSATKANFTVNVPSNAVPASTRIEFSVVGDLLGSAMKNLDNLIRMPTGCGEQNMLLFVPNIVILNYLRSINQLPGAIESQAKHFMTLGYQRELNYRHRDGSFSAFGEIDASGSTWLTAFVVRSLHQADEHIDVDESIIDEALRFLVGTQAENGSFPELGNVIHADLQGPAGGGIALTAYTLLAFLENKPTIATYRNVINKAMDYIVRNLETLDDAYSLALAAYALQLAEHNARDYVLRKLDERAVREDGQMFWRKTVSESERRSVWYARPNSLNTEMTAYGLLAHILSAGPRSSDAQSIVKWLLAQQNAKGGFASTQDTVVALQALAKVAERSAPSTDMRVSVKYGDGLAREVSMSPGNRAIVQTFSLPNSIRAVNVSASGHGSGVFALSYRYNANVTGAWPRFTVDPQVNRNSNADYLHLTVCTSFVPAPEDVVKVSNMVVMEVEFPSGFTADTETIPSLEAGEHVKKVETRSGDTVMVIYFDALGTKELCPTVDAFRTHKVAMLKPAAVRVYDYYDTTRKALMFYRVAESRLCDICEDENECAELCAVKPSEQRADASMERSISAGSSASKALGGSVIIMAIVGIANAWV